MTHTAFAATGGVGAPRLLSCRGRQLPLGEGPLVMGILNVTPDSFYDGGRFVNLDSALAQAGRLMQEGAAVLDVGGQSTRPGHEEVSEEEELARVVPVVRALAGRFPVVISVDTYRPAVARAALGAGAHIVNDVHGLQRFAGMAQVVGEFGAPVVVMHQEAGFAGLTDDPIMAMRRFFERSLELAAKEGVADDRVILDPGIGFGKTHEQNLEILGRLSELAMGKCPLLLGASRKSVIGRVLDLPPDDRLEGTLATTALAVWQGVDFIRVHDVRANLRVARMAHAIRRVPLK